MYIKNRRNITKAMSFGISSFAINRKFGSPQTPTFHIPTVSGN